MKLRISGSSVRLRLTRGEVAEFAKTGMIEQRTPFGGEPNRHLSYSIAAESDAAEVSVKFEDSRISVVIPPDIARNWSQTEEVGISAEQSLPDGKTLRILVEKDFTCLIPRAGEDESDHFPHPKSEKNC